MQGEDLRAMLDADPNAAPLEQDNNEYLVSYRFDTGAELAFDPRTTTKCSVFIARLPERMKDRLGEGRALPAGESVYRASTGVAVARKHAPALQS